MVHKYTAQVFLTLLQIYVFILCIIFVEFWEKISTSILSFCYKLIFLFLIFEDKDIWHRYNDKAVQTSLNRFQFLTLNTCPQIALIVLLCPPPAENELELPFIPTLKVLIVSYSNNTSF